MEGPRTAGMRRPDCEVTAGGPASKQAAVEGPSMMTPAKSCVGRAPAVGTDEVEGRPAKAGSGCGWRAQCKHAHAVSTTESGRSGGPSKQCKVEGPIAMQSQSVYIWAGPGAIINKGREI